MMQISQAFRIIAEYCADSSKTLHMSKDLLNKTALVTGAGSGIGRSSSLLLAREGARVLVSDISSSHAEQTVSAIVEQGGTASAFTGDVSHPDVCQAMVQQALDRYGRLDIACNNAGIGGEIHPLADMSLEGWSRIIAINLSSVFYCMKYEIAAMLKQGGGSIINMASILGAVGFPGSCGYVAAKHGVIGLSQNAALEYSAQGIRVNAIGPGFIETPLLSALDEATHRQLVQLHPIGRLGRPEEVAELVLWLGSDRSSFASGTYYPLDGGYLAR